MPLRNSLPEIPSGWVHQHSSSLFSFPQNYKPERLLINSMKLHTFLNNFTCILNNTMHRVHYIVHVCCCFPLLESKENPSDTAVSSKFVFIYSHITVYWFDLPLNMSDINSIFQTLIYTVKSQMKSRHHLVCEGNCMKNVSSVLFILHSCMCGTEVLILQFSRVLNSKGWTLKERYCLKAYSGWRLFWRSSWRTLPEKGKCALYSVPKFCNIFI